MVFAIRSVERGEHLAGPAQERPVGRPGVDVPVQVAAPDQAGARADQHGIIVAGGAVARACRHDVAAIGTASATSQDKWPTHSKDGHFSNVCGRHGEWRSRERRGVPVAADISLLAGYFTGERTVRSLCAAPDRRMGSTSRPRHAFPARCRRCAPASAAAGCAAVAGAVVVSQ